MMGGLKESALIARTEEVLKVWAQMRLTIRQRKRSYSGRLWLQNSLPLTRSKYLPLKGQSVVAKWLQIVVNEIAWLS